MLLKFCSCGNKLSLNLTKDVFYCAKCTDEYTVKDEETLISTGHAQASTYIAGKYDTYIRNGAHDVTNEIIFEDCSKCGLNYKTLMLVGKDKKAVTRCKCGS